MSAGKKFPIPLNVRVTAADVARLDALAAALAARTPGTSMSKSDAARAAILRGLAELELEHGIVSGEG